jgi:hypothetical protein
MMDGDGRTLVGDSEGAVFADLICARKEAVGWARDIVRHEFPEPIRTWKVLVTDEEGEIVLTVALSEIRPCKMSRSRFELSRHIARLDYTFGGRLFDGLLVAAMLVVVVQAGLRIAPVTEEGGGYQLAAVRTKAPLVAVRFVERASLADITKLLDAYNASLVDGPRPGDLFKIRIASAASSPSELAKIVGRMAKEKVVEFAAVVE